MDYSSYLDLPRLLGAQNPVSRARGAEAHDEHLFIVIHQAYELWFKQILHELGSVARIFGGRALDESDLSQAVNAAERCVKIQHLLVSQIDVLETMTPMDFLEFRDLLVPASGFQSAQFRMIETRLGLKRAQRLGFDGGAFDDDLPADDRAAIRALEAMPSLRDEVGEWLARMPFAEVTRKDGPAYDFSAAYTAALDRILSEDMVRIAGNARLTEAQREAQTGALTASHRRLDALFDDAAFAAQAANGAWGMPRAALEAALFIFLYRDEPALQLPFRMLRALMDMDELWALWRLRHALMAERMIGRRTGTGGSSGYGYLRATAEQHRIFGDLFALATFMIPRSALPPLPGDIRRSMRFRYER
jgi:tryptophan 2,3-dioxygenase